MNKIKESVKYKYLNVKILTRDKLVFAYERNCFVYVRDKTNDNSSPSRSLYHINVTGIGLHFWRRGWPSGEMLQMVYYLLSAPFPSTFFANTHVTSNIPRLTTDETIPDKTMVYREDDTCGTRNKDVLN